MTTKQYHSLWSSLVDQHLKDEWLKAIADKLKRIRFERNGEMKPGKLRLYAEKHFPHLVNKYRVQRQAQEIPKRQARTRIEHHSPKKSQLKLFDGNQLDLY